MSGNPSGRSSTRPTLSKEEVDAFAEGVLSQFWKVIDRDRVELRRNSEWLEPLGLEDILRLDGVDYGGADAGTRRLREPVRDRRGPSRSWSSCIRCFRETTPWPSEADIELGGTDQLFNLLVGRELQRDVGKDPQIALTMPLLEGLDGVQKMSQSLGNYVGVDEPPEDMFGKLMSIPDQLIAKYVLLCTDLGADDNARVSVRAR